MHFAYHGLTTACRRIVVFLTFIVFFLCDRDFFLSPNKRLLSVPDEAAN